MQCEAITLGPISLNCSLPLASHTNRFGVLALRSWQLRVQLTFSPKFRQRINQQSSRRSLHLFLQIDPLVFLPSTFHVQKAIFLLIIYLSTAEETFEALKTYALFSVVLAIFIFSKELFQNELKIIEFAKKTQQCERAIVSMTHFGTIREHSPGLSFKLPN